mmetsp:Transcript_14270/g.21981  ORF Transcript_14270/g.21981 Transcript_14270/m.21981 type:complete len:290 (+) Transcript_14270:16-885(+)
MHDHMTEVDLSLSAASPPSSGESMPVSSRKNLTTARPIDIESVGDEANNEEILPVNSQQSLTGTTEGAYLDSYKVEYWRAHKYAVGLTNPTWEDEKTESTFCDESCCLYITGMACSNSCFRAGRIGNMVVLRENSNGSKCMVGPFWPWLIFITYPLIFGVSGVCYFKVVRKFSAPEQVFWFALTFGLIIALSFTGFRDPGILLRKSERQIQSWIWNDQALTYRPRGARYDSDCGCVIEGFDHTCPWTGTGIGKKNMGSFQCFVGLVFLNLIIDVMLLTGAITSFGIGAI